MIRHHVILVLNDDAKDLAQPIVDALLEWAPRCPEIHDYKVGTDLNLADNTGDVAVVGEFASVEDYQAYAANEEHQVIIQTMIAPNAATLVRCQTEF